MCSMRVTGYPPKPWRHALDAYKFAATLTTTVEGLQRAEGHESRQP